MVKRRILLSLGAVLSLSMTTGCTLLDVLMNPGAVGVFGNQILDQGERLGGQWGLTGGQLINRILGILG